MGQCIFTSVCMLIDQECHLEIYYGRLLSSHTWILVNQQLYGGKHESFCMRHRFKSGREWPAREYFWYPVGPRIDWKSDRMGTKIFNYIWNQLSVALHFQWIIHFNKHQCSINGLWSGNHGYCNLIWSLLCITNILAACIGKIDSDPAPFRKWVPTEH
jgi:hypothetical protein